MLASVAKPVEPKLFEMELEPKLSLNKYLLQFIWMMLGYRKTYFCGTCIGTVWYSVQYYCFGTVLSNSMWLELELEQK